jgi:hypothetical protein
VSLKKRLRTLLVCALLQVGALQGAPMRPEQIEELMQQLNQAKLAHLLPSENDNGDDPPED